MVLTILLLAFQVVAPAPAPVAAADVDPGLAAVVARFFEAQEKEDIEGYMALWSPKAPAPPRAQLQYIFDSGDDVYSEIVITDVKLAGETARLRVSARRTRSLAPRPGSTVFGPPSTFRMNIAFTLERVSGEWKLVSEGPAADHVAVVLLEAKSDVERDAVLAAETELGGQPVLGSLGRLAGAAAVRGDYHHARQIYETMVFVARRGGFRKEEGEALQNIANTFYFQRRFPDALAAYEQRFAVERERNDELGMAAALAGIGTIRYSFGEYSESLTRYQEALALHEKTDDVAGIAFVSLSIGNIGYLQGDFAAAIAAYRRALDLNRTMFNADGESRALEGLGRVYSTQGDYAAALEVFEAVRSDKRMATVHSRLAPIAQNIGEVHFRLGNLEAARASYEESRDHYEAARDLPNVGRVIQALALTELALSRFRAAEALYNRSGDICGKADDPECAARAIAGLAFALSAQDRFFESAASYRKAIDAFKALNLREEMARSQIGLSEVLVGAGDLAGGVEAAAGARGHAVAMASDDVLWRALTAEARAVRKLGDRPRAIGVARAAVAAIDRLEATARDRPAGSLPVDVIRAFETFAILQAETGDAAGAFATAERLHAVELRAALAINEREISRGMTGEERAEERRLASQVATLLARIAREKGLPKPEAARLASLQEALEAARVERRAAMTRLFERLPDLARWRGLGPSTVPDLQALTGSGALLISLVLDDEDLLVLANAPPSEPDAQDAAAATAPPIPRFEAYVVPLKRRQIAELTALMQQPAVLADPAAWKRAASELAALLPGDVVRRLHTASQVTIVPHEVLWRVPFHALPSGDGYLVDHAEVVVAGSAAMAARAREQPAGEPGALLTVGAPQLAQARLDRMKDVAPAWTLRAADEAMREIDAANATWADGKETLTGAAATERAFREALGRASLVHVASPFRINAASPLFSGIVLSVPDGPAREPGGDPSSPPGTASAAVPDPADDGALELREVMNLSSPARLGILSDSAATSMRDSAPAVQVVQWGWLAAGVPSLVISRWSGPPSARERLLAELHTRLQAGDTPAAALSAAQRLLRSTRETAAPLNWAGWMIVGAR